jgi:S1-C subfamily serine protease/tetratricopeptide (TPR) repeat protein
MSGNAKFRFLLAFFLLAMNCFGCAGLDLMSSDTLLELQERVQKNPEDADAHYHLGHSYALKGRYQEALNSFKESVRIKPNNKDAHYNIGLSFSLLRQLEEANAAYKKAIRIYPEFAEAYNNLAANYVELQLPEEAIVNLKKVLGLKPSFGNQLDLNADIHTNFGTAYQQLGQYQKALAEYKEALRNRPTFNLARDLLRKLEKKIAFNNVQTPEPSQLSSFCKSGKILPIDCTEADKNSREIWFEFRRLESLERKGIGCEIYDDYPNVEVMRNGNLLVNYPLEGSFYLGALEILEFLDLKVKPESALVAVSGINGFKFDPKLLFEFKQTIKSIHIKFADKKKKIRTCTIFYEKDKYNIYRTPILSQVRERQSYESSHAEAAKSSRRFGKVAPPIVPSKPRTQPPVAEAPPQSQKPSPQSGTGSGFFVSKMGHVITNAHVVQNCKKITIGDNANKQVPAELINTDRSNDLALLKLSTLEMASAESKSLIQKLGIVVVPLASKGLLRSEDVKLGEKVLVAGYPFGELFSNTIKVTSGIVSATRGAGDDSGQFQLDAAVQPGNSGGPIYDSSGNIVGVVISQLDKLKMAKAIGSLPENVNFGIKASTVRQFLISSGVPSKKSERTEEKSTEQLAEIAKNQALMVMCLQ